MPTPDEKPVVDTLIVGIAVVDAVASPVDRLPAPGGLRFFDELTFTTGGCAVNCSIAMAKLGVEADVVARVGRDPLGEFVLAELARHGVACCHVRQDPARPTSFSFVGVHPGGERSFLHTKGANAHLCVEDVPPALLAGKRFVFVTGCMLMDALDGAPTAELLRRARAAGARTLLDTVYVEGVERDEWRRRVWASLPELDYFVPSEPEARALTGEDAPERMAGVLREAGARRVVVKLGVRGVYCLDEDGRGEVVPACRVERVVDATGAGDCWAAGFLIGLREGRAMVEAARLGNAVAGVSIQGAGATTGIRGMEQVLELLRG